MLCFGHLSSLPTKNLATFKLRVGNIFDFITKFIMKTDEVRSVVFHLGIS